MVSKTVRLEDVVPEVFSYSKKETFLVVGGITPSVAVEQKFDGILSEARVEQKFDGVNAYKNLNLEEMYNDLSNILEAEVKRFVDNLKEAIAGVVELFKSFSAKYSIPVYITVNDFLKVIASQVMGYVSFEDVDEGVEEIARVCRQTKLSGNKVVTVCSKWFKIAVNGSDIYIKVEGEEQ